MSVWLVRDFYMNLTFWFEISVYQSYAMLQLMDNLLYIIVTAFPFDFILVRLACLILRDPS
jgi:hypothetical protein